MRCRTTKTMVLLAVPMALVLLGPGGTAGATAADADDISVTLDPGDTFADDFRLTVVVSGLDDFRGDMLAVYLCGNADTAGTPINPTQADCTTRGDGDQYGEADIDLPTMRVPLQLRVSGIGENRATCVAAASGASCQVIVAVASEDAGILIGMPVDELLDAPADRVELPTTGPSPLTIVVLMAGAAFLYLGWLVRSAGTPARLELRNH